MSVTQGEELLRTEDILSIIEDQGDSIALVMSSGKSTICLFTKMAKCDIFYCLIVSHTSVCTLIFVKIGRNINSLTYTCSPLTVHC